MAFPSNGEAAVLIVYELEQPIVSVDEAFGAPVELIAEPPFGRSQQQTLVGEPGGLVDPEVEADQMSDRLRPDAALAVSRDGDRQRVGAARADITNQDGGPPVDEALGQPLVERVGKARLDQPRPL